LSKSKHKRISNEQVEAANDEVKVPIQTQAPTPKSIMIATPMYGGMCTGAYVHGLLMTIARCRELNMPVYWANMVNESLITRARNELVRIFLEHGYDYLMFIDADISFDGAAVVQMVEADKEVVCGIYPKKEVDWAQIKRAALAGVEDLENYGGAFVFNLANGPNATSDEKGLIEIRHGGTGFMLIKREVFTNLMPHVPTYRVSGYKDEKGEYTKPITHEFFATSIDEGGTLLSEDFHFCDLFRKHGGTIYANPFIKLEHVGTYTYSGELLKSGGNLK